MADEDIRRDSFPLRTVDKLGYADTEARYDKLFRPALAVCSSRARRRSHSSAGVA
jgi:hypothetical protein